MIQSRSSHPGDVVVDPAPLEAAGFLFHPESIDLLPDELYLVGTAHVSKNSADLGYHAVRAVKPDAVVVELCM